MRLTELRRIALSTGVAAALLTGCGGSQPPMGAPGTMPQSPAIAEHANHGGSWMLPEAKGEDLIYASNWGHQRPLRHRGIVTVYSYATQRLVGNLKGFTLPSGLCVDKRGDVFVSDYENYRVVEYAHGASTPIAILADPGKPFSCSVDATTGDLAVTNGGVTRGETLAVYKRGTGTPKEYADAGSISNFYFCSYDNEGNLFVNGTGGVSGNSAALAELPKNGKHFINFNFNTGPSLIPGGIMWDQRNRYLAFGVGLDGDSVDLLSKVGERVKRKGSLSLGNGYLQQYWLQPRRKILIGGWRSTSTYGLGFWKYPLGGSPLSIITDGIDNPFGVTVSLAPSR
ncbi:MAG: hypothetical protein WCB99_06550 [Candidatus Cybelea sp.]